MFRFLLLLLGLFLLPFNANALEEILLKGKELTILSDELHYDRDKNVAVFTTDVHAYQPSLDIYGDKMVVELLSDAEHSVSTEGKIKYIHITGNVKIITDSEKISSDSAEYKPNENKIIMTGDVELVQNNNVVTGSELIYDTVTRSARIISKDKNKRIKAKFTFDSNE